MGVATLCSRWREKCSRRNSPILPRSNSTRAMTTSRRWGSASLRLRCQWCLESGRSLQTPALTSMLRAVRLRAFWSLFSSTRLVNCGRLNLSVDACPTLRLLALSNFTISGYGFVQICIRRFDELEHLYNMCTKFYCRASACSVRLLMWSLVQFASITFREHVCDWLASKLYATAPASRCRDAR